MTNRLRDFLSKNTIKRPDLLPLVHSTPAYCLRRILSEKTIRRQPCKTFVSEDLVYFFVGRPAYKWSTESDAEFWELPSCIIMDYKPANVTRIFPFDSGGYSKELFPSFIQMMGLDALSLGQDLATAQSFIGAFFTSPRNYFHLRPRHHTDFNRRFEVDVLDHEVQALYKLVHSAKSEIDDRRIAIEVQSSEDVALVPGKVLAVVFPEPYLDSDEFMNYVEVDLKAEALSYPIFPMRAEFYFQTMYAKVAEFYESKGLM